MNDAALSLAKLDESIVLIVIVSIIAGLILVGIVFSSIRRIVETRSKEQTRREIAAYVAEGSISPDDASKLLGNAHEEAERKISDAVAWGVLSSKKAEELIRAIRNDGPPPERPANA